MDEGAEGSIGVSPDLRYDHSCCWWWWWWWWCWCNSQVLAYNEANRKVAILCNHQRTVTKATETALENLTEKVGSRYHLNGDHHWSLKLRE